MEGTLTIGKKWASGSVEGYLKSEVVGSQQSYNINISLDFNPSNIIFTFKMVSSYGFSPRKITISSLMNNSYETAVYYNNGVNCDVYITNLTSSNATIFIDKRQAANYFFTLHEISWIAYE